MKKTYFVYMMSNKYRNVLYTGLTNSLKRRIQEHQNKSHAGFTAKYNVTDLVYFEEFDDINAAIERETQIKKYSRDKKNALISKTNPSNATLIIDQ